MAAVAKNGGMSMTNGYDVQFDLSSTPGLSNELKKFNIDINSSNDTATPGSLINMFCDEAQLPAMQFATGQINGRYLGRGNLNYAHTRLVSDFNLSWMCDANMAPYKFLTAWYNFIQGTTLESKDATSLKDFKSSTKPQLPNLAMRLRYPIDYQVILRIAKTERGNNAPNSRTPIVHVITGVYPYSVDAVPLSYGSSQITKVSANFYYDQITTVAADIRSFKG